MPLSSNVWLRLRPSLPQTASNIGESVTWKPVATTMASTSRAVPSLVMIDARRSRDTVGDQFDVVAVQGRDTNRWR